MPFINGTDIIVTVDSVTIAKSTNCSIRLNADLPDSTTKDSLGWSNHIQGVRSAEIDLDAFSTENETINFNVLAGYQLTRTQVNVQFTSLGQTLSGLATIQDVSEISENENVARYSLTLSLSGELTGLLSALLLETGDFFLLETGDKLLLE